MRWLAYGSFGAAVLLAACPKRVPEPLSPPGRLTVMHTNDLHGHYLPERAEWLPGEPSIGGFARLEQEVRGIRDRVGTDNTLLLDGGDILTGTPLTAMQEEGAKGTPMLRFMEAVGYDGWVVGNHEFDRGLDNLKLLSAKATFAVLSANLRAKDGTTPLLPNQVFSTVFERNGLRVGVIGATTDALKSLVSPADWGRMATLPAIDAVRAEALRLDPATDVLIALTHIGVDDDKRLAAAVPSLDLIVGGHSHTPLKSAIQQGSTYIVQAGSYTRSLGIVELDVANDQLVGFKYELRDLTPETAPVLPSESLTQLADHYRENIDQVYGEVLSRAPSNLQKDYHHESGLMRWITDAIRASADTDIAVYNGGGLRAEIVSGDVTRRHLFECFPFENAIYTFPITGEQLVGLVLGNVAADANESRSFLGISGVKWTWRMASGAPEVASLSVGTQPVDLARTYSLAATSYIVDQSEKFLGFRPAEPTLLGVNDFEAAVAYAREKGVYDSGEKRGQRVE